MIPLIPEPILLNCWKHHLGFLLEKIRDYKSENQLKSLRSHLLNIGNSTTDLYTGKISPLEASRFAIEWIRKEGHFSPDQYSSWIRNSSEEYRCLKYPDDSVWVFRIGIEPGRYIHIHPGRNVPHTLRIKANVLKSAVGTVICSRVYRESPFSISIINKSRYYLLGLSPIKSITPGSEFKKILELFSKQIES